MYTFTNKLRNFSIILMVVGFFGLTYGFLTSPKTVEEATAMVADVHHGEGHNDGHSNTTNDENHVKQRKVFPFDMRIGGIHNL